MTTGHVTDPDPDDGLSEIADRLRAERAVPTRAVHERASARLADAILRRALQPRAAALITAGTLSLALATLLALRPL